jgi:carbonic anhydrase
LKEGNERFFNGEMIHPDETLERIRSLKFGQNLFVVVVSCSDSRVPPEIIFNQGLGDIFTVHTAGNVIGDYELGSVEYAVEHLGCSLVVVLGHYKCGAIQTFFECNGKYEHLDHIKDIVESLKNEEEEEEQALIQNQSITTDKSVLAKIELGVNTLLY